MTKRAMTLSILTLSLAGFSLPGVALAQSGTTLDGWQQPTGTLVAQNQSQEFVVYFALGQATLDSEARATVAAAADAYHSTGTARITVRGHTDTSGSASLNQALSERRQLAVTNELVRLGVPAAAIAGAALGETDPAVPTADGVREPQNRRVEIAVAQPAPPPQPEPAPAPEPAPPVATTPPPQPPPQPARERPRGTFSVGPFYGFNLEDEAGHNSHLAGVNFSLDYAVVPWAGVGVEQAVFYHFDTPDDGFGGRTAGGLDLVLGMEDFTAHAGGNIGYLYGDGFDDEFFAGPEIGFAAGPFNAKVAYDIPFNRDFDEGIIATTIGYGIRF